MRERKDIFTEIDEEKSNSGVLMKVRMVTSENVRFPSVSSSPYVCSPATRDGSVPGDTWVSWLNPFRDSLFLSLMPFNYPTVWEWLYKYVKQQSKAVDFLGPKCARNAIRFVPGAFWRHQ